MRNTASYALEQLRRLVIENPVLQQQLQESKDLPAAMETIRSFAEQQSGELDMNQITAGLQQAIQACDMGREISDKQLEGVAAGADPMKIFLAIITLGITAAIDAGVEERRKYAEGYGG